MKNEIIIFLFELCKIIGSNMGISKRFESNLWLLLENFHPNIITIIRWSRLAKKDFFKMIS